jgi:hypothetical protein
MIMTSRTSPFKVKNIYNGEYNGDDKDNDKDKDNGQDGDFDKGNDIA